MQKLQIVFLGAKKVGYECLQFIEAQQEKLNFEITAVLSKSNPALDGQFAVSDFAQIKKIPVLETLDELPNCDLILSVQYHEILKPEHLSKARKAAINLHMAPLPEYRGANQFTMAILENKEEFGATLHLMDEKIDHGGILAETRFAIPPNCWVEDLYQLTEKESIELLKREWKKIIQNKIRTKSQERRIKKFGSSFHYKKEVQSLKIIDLDWEAEKVERHIRATCMPGFEPPYCLIDQKKVYFTRK